MRVEEIIRGEYNLFPENDETLENIGVAIIQSSYELARPVASGFLRNHWTELTEKMARKMLRGKDISNDYLTNWNKRGEVSMDYVFGRQCKTHIWIKEDRVRIIISIRDRNPEAILKRAEEKLKR